MDENLNVQITADKFGAYALGKLLALYAPELVADLGGSKTQTAESLFAQMAQGVAGLPTRSRAGLPTPATRCSLPSTRPISPSARRWSPRRTIIWWRAASATARHSRSIRIECAGFL
ncbi:MAG: hypothetical protein WDN04_27090 [Rhodospirillales bacterium]